MTRPRADRGQKRGDTLQFIRFHHLRVINHTLDRHWTPDRKPAVRAPRVPRQLPPVHLCECGCGTPTSLSKGSKHGPPNGTFHRFALGHHWRVKTPKGPKQIGTAGKGETTFYRIRAERALGKPLPKGAEVHHADGSRRDDAPLVICQDHAYHMLLHARMKARARALAS